MTETAIPRQHAIHAWQPKLDVAADALWELCAVTAYEDAKLCARAVLDASGASEEIERLRAVLHAAQHVIDTLRAENRDQLNLLLALTLEPVVADLAAGAIDKALVAVASPGHEDGWTNQGMEQR